MADERILINGNRVIASGSITAPATHPVEIDPLPAKFGALRVILTFQTKEGEKGAFSGVWTDKVFNVTFTNFGNPLGSALIDTVEIAKIGNRKILLFLSSHVFGETPTEARVINYTFTVEGDADV